MLSIWSCPKFCSVGMGEYDYNIYICQVESDEICLWKE